MLYIRKIKPSRNTHSDSTRTKMLFNVNLPTLFAVSVSYLFFVTLKTIIAIIRFKVNFEKDINKNIFGPAF